MISDVESKPLLVPPMGTDYSLASQAAPPPASAPPPPPMVMTTGAQTDDEWVPFAKIPDMTVQSIRHELSRLRLPTDGVKPEIVARLKLAMSRARD